MKNKKNENGKKRFTLKVKKRLIIIFIIFTILLGFVPEIWSGTDGGTIMYEALFYTVIVWRQIPREDMSHRTGIDIYILPFIPGAWSTFGHIHIEGR